jgi:hypothetical protein
VVPPSLHYLGANCFHQTKLSLSRLLSPTMINGHLFSRKAYKYAMQHSTQALSGVSKLFLVSSPRIQLDYDPVVPAPADQGGRKAISLRFMGPKKLA